MKRSNLFAAVAATALMFASSAFAEKIANPEYTSWSKFKVGASAKVEGVATVAGSTNKSTVTTKLIEMTADKAVIEMTISMEMMGNKMDMPAQKREIAATIDAPATPPKTDAAADAKPEAKTTEESVTVAGKEIKCKVVENDSDSNGMKAHTKSWNSDEVPGGLVKLESKATAPMESTSSMTLVDFTTGG